MSLVTGAGVHVDVSRASILDPRAMAWLANPENAHEGDVDKVAAEFYPSGFYPDGSGNVRGGGGGGGGGGLGSGGLGDGGLGGGDHRDSHGGGVTAAGGVGSALERFRDDMLTCASLALRLRRDRLNHLPEVVRSEGQVAAALGQLEHVGVGFDAGRSHRVYSHRIFNAAFTRPLFNPFTTTKKTTKEYVSTPVSLNYALSRPANTCVMCDVRKDDFGRGLRATRCHRAQGSAPGAGRSRRGDA